MRSENEERRDAPTQSPDRMNSPPLRPETSGSILSRPSTCGSIMSRPYTSTKLKGSQEARRGQSQLSALHALVERMHAGGQSPASALGDLAGDAGFVSRDMLGLVFLVQDDPSRLSHVDALMSSLDPKRTGKISVEELIGTIVTSLGPEAAHAKLWRHPVQGFVKVSERLWALLHAVQQQAKRRWHRGGEETFATLDRDAGQPLEKRDIQAVLSYLAVFASTADVKEIWEFLHQGGTVRCVSWSDLKKVFGVEPRGDTETVVQYSTAPQGAMRRLGGKRSKRSRSKSAPIEGEFATEEEEIADIMSTTYNRFYSHDDDLDYFSPFGPLRHRGYHSRPSSRMRPLTSEASDSLHTKSNRGVQWNVSGDPTPPRLQARPSMRRQRADAEGTGTVMAEAMVQPFTNVGSTLRMPWRRWAGGDTIGPAKLPLQDPAAPGQTASLVPGTGEFRRSYEAR